MTFGKPEVANMLIFAGQVLSMPWIVLVVAIIVAMAIVPVGILIAWVVWMIVQRKPSATEIRVFGGLAVLACLYYVWFFSTFSWPFW
jgi:hypothetical protein